MDRQLKDIVPSRRDLLKLGGMALATACVDRIVWPMKVSAAAPVTPRGTARNAILVDLPGAISQPDCWDFKETRFTVKDLDVRQVTSDLYLSKTLFPNYEDWAPRSAFVRSMRAHELAHFIGQYHTQTGRALNAAVAKEIPAFGSVIAAELDHQRRESDSFPTYMSINLANSRPGAIGSGFFPARFTGMDLDSYTALGSFGGGGGDAAAEALRERYDALMILSEVSAAERASLGDMASDYKAYYQSAYSIMDDPRFKKVFDVSEEEQERYGTEDFGLRCILAKNLLAADAGTRFVYVIDGRQPWDHHSYIFDHTNPENHYVTCLAWDKAFSNLIKDMASMPGHEAGKSLLDETIILATSEFGRMPVMNNAEGRDHYGEVYTSFYVGGGVKPGRIVGATDELAAKCIDTGWKHKEQPAMDNHVATLYSALGIDWSKTIENTPSTRAYHYLQAAPIGGGEFLAFDAIDELFE